MYIGRVWFTRTRQQAGPLGEVVVDGLGGSDVIVDGGHARQLPLPAHQRNARQPQPRGPDRRFNTPRPQMFSQVGTRFCSSRIIDETLLKNFMYVMLYYVMSRHVTRTPPAQGGGGGRKGDKLRVEAQQQRRGRPLRGRQRRGRRRRQPGDMRFLFRKDASAAPATQRFFPERKHRRRQQQKPTFQNRNVGGVSLA